MSDDAVAHLMEVAGCTRERAVEALTITSGNIEHAAQFLLSNAQ